MASLFHWIVGRRGGGVIKPFRLLPHDAAADESFQRAQFGMVLVRHEADGVANLIRAAGAANAVDVILHVHRKIVVHHVRDAVHVNAARRDVRRHQHPHHAFLEILQRAQPLVLRAVRVQRRTAHALLLQLPRQPVGGVLHPRENQHHVHLRVLQQMQQQRRLQMLRHFIEKLRHRLGGIGAPANLDDFWRVLKFVRQRFDLLGQGRREHQRLPLLRQGLHDAPDVRQKTHVQHPVRLVEHEIFQLRKIGGALAHQVQQPAGARHNHVRARPQGADLRLFPDAAKHRRHRQRQVLRVSPDVFLDLHHQFARRRDHQHLCSPPRARLRRELGENRQRERRRLARARLRDADEVVAREDRRDGGGLDRRRLGVTGFRDRPQNFGIKAKNAE